MQAGLSQYRFMAFVGLFLLFSFLFLISVSVYSWRCPRFPLPFWISKKEAKKESAASPRQRIEKVRNSAVFTFLFSISMSVYSGLCPHSPLPFWCPKRKRKKHRRLRRFFYSMLSSESLSFISSANATSSSSVRLTPFPILS